MKHTENNEIDILLRSLAKREGSRSASNTSGSAMLSGEHLDADELNSFTEHTLPPATRARYMSHVVDCTRCRQIVTELTTAAGLPVVKMESERVTSFWQSLSAFLSPSVLRFAVPALAILAVLTVGLITLRQQNRASLVAQNQETPSETTTEKTDSQAYNPGIQAPTTGASNLALKSPERPASTIESPAKAGEKVGTSAAPPTTDSVARLMAKDAPKPSIVTDGQPATQPTFAPEPAPAPPAALQQKAAAPAAVSKNEVAAKQQEQPETGFLSREMRDERAAEDKEAAMSRSRKAAGAGRGGVGAQPMNARREESDSKRNDEDSQTRAVEGRRFRRQGNTWVDTAYDGSRPTTTVVRGSEQYRALVADEPGIRLIAEKLSGEVVLVWKGRAYRIR